MTHSELVDLLGLRNEIDHAIFQFEHGIKNDEFVLDYLYKRWVRIGLLEGLSEEQGLMLSIYLETALCYLIKDRTIKDKSKTETMLFPIIRRVYADNKLPPSLTVAYDEYQRYSKEISDFTMDNKHFEMANQLDIIGNNVKNFYRWLPQIIEEFHEHSDIFLKYIEGNFDMDKEAVCCAMYSDNFDIDRIEKRLLGEKVPFDMTKLIQI